jgi:pyruvate ferredoxin oxidoreductase alpha subunit
VSYGLAGGPVFHEVRSYVGAGDRLISYVYGLGGRDITPGDIEAVFIDLAAGKPAGGADGVYKYIGLRET